MPLLIGKGDHVDRQASFERGLPGDVHAGVTLLPDNAVWMNVLGRVAATLALLAMRACENPGTSCSIRSRLFPPSLSMSPSLGRIW